MARRWLPLGSLNPPGSSLGHEVLQLSLLPRTAGLVVEPCSSSSRKVSGLTPTAVFALACGDISRIDNVVYCR
jgi:hypothetical protein